MHGAQWRTCYVALAGMVVETSDAGDQPCSGMQDCLQSAEDAVCDTVEKSVTIVDTT